MCRYPVGEGAKRVMTLRDMATLCCIVVVPVFGQAGFRRSCSTAGRGRKLEDHGRQAAVDERSLLLAPPVESLPVASVPAPKSGRAEFAKVPELPYVRQTIHRLATSVQAHAAREATFGSLFLLVPVFLGAGAVSYFKLQSEPPWATIWVALVLAGLFRLIAARRRFACLILNAMLLFVLGTAFAKFETFRHQQIVLGGELSTNVEGLIRTIEKTASGHRITIEVLATTAPALKFQPTGVRISTRSLKADFRPGDRVSARMRLQPPSGPLRPDGFDFAFHSWFNDIGATGYPVSPLILLERPTTTPFQFRLESLRQTIAERIRARLSGDQAEVAAALIGGVQGGISEPTSEAMRVSGLSHVLSISGLHMAIVAGLFLFGIRGLFALFPGFSQKYPIKKGAALAAFAACLFYLAMSGAAVATLRSFLMIGVMLMAVVLDRPALTMRNLMIAALIILVITPHEIMGPSFQMSYAATAALIAGYQYWAPRQKDHGIKHEKKLGVRIAGWLLSALIGTAVTSILAGLATALYSIWHFQRLAPLGLLANVLAMIPISFLIMPFGVVAIFLMPLGLEGLALDVMGQGIAMMIDISGFVASYSPDAAFGAISPLAFGLGTISIALFLILQTRLRLMAIPFAIAAILTSWAGASADILVSDDAKLVAVRLESGAWAINRSRPDSFVAQIWQRAIPVKSFEKPVFQPAKASLVGKGMGCSGIICRVQGADGIRLLWIDYPKAEFTVRNKSAAPVDYKADVEKAASERSRIFAFTQTIGRHCDEADILVVNGPMFGMPCKGKGSILVSAKELALKGAAEIRVTIHEPQAKSPNDPGVRPIISIRYAIQTPDRPWNEHRKFSRAARNMEPFRPRPQPKPQPGLEMPKTGSDQYLRIKPTSLP